jgi:kynurenine 3-monooxygenase
MHGRMVHTRSVTGALKHESQAYDVHGRFQRSIDRGDLNKLLLDVLEEYPNVSFFFQHKLTGADFRRKKAWFEDHSGPSDNRANEKEIPFDFLIGADGAHSATRHHLMKYARMDYSQTYIDCLWCEFSIPPSTSNDFRISPNHLHIWPAGSFMFIALPSLDKSFVCTLFGPASLFDQIERGDGDELFKVFETYFPGVAGDLISKSDLQAQFQKNPHLPLINIKCNPHHYSDSVVILGDAANAIVPFYGQGMNAGLESVRILFEKLDAHPENRAAALGAYTKERVVDTHEIADLALGNYIEMRDSVTSPVYKLRKYVEETLDKWLPGLGWATQYSRVSFSNMRYSEVSKRSARQKKVLLFLFALLGMLGGVGLKAVAARWWKGGGGARYRQWRLKR